MARRRRGCQVVIGRGVNRSECGVRIETGATTYLGYYGLTMVG